MGCLKCGRETISEQVFCPECLAEMEKYPVRPGTVVQLPMRKSAAPKKPPKKRVIAAEDQVKLLKKRIRVLAVLLALVTALAAVMVKPAAEHWQETHRKKGQNYTTIVPTEQN